MALQKKAIPDKQVTSSKVVAAKKVASTKPTEKVTKKWVLTTKNSKSKKSAFKANKPAGVDAFVVFVENANNLVTYCYHSEFNKKDNRNTYLATKATEKEAHEFALDYANKNGFTPQYT